MAETFGQRFDQHTDNIITATTKLMNELADRVGKYVWKKYDSEGGNLLGYVVSDDFNAYPNGATQDGYYYKILATPHDMVSWARGTDAQIAKMVELADAGVIDLNDYWAVGDTRTVSLSAMTATGVGESHTAQDVEFVLMHTGGYELNTPTKSGRTTCSFIVGMKDCLTVKGYMNSSNTNSGSWNSSARRTWCNNVFRNAIPSDLRGIFKQFKCITAEERTASTNKVSIDYFALPAAKEIFGGTASSAGSATGFSTLAEFNALFQYDWYRTTSNRVKTSNGSTTTWWERSPFYYNSANFCHVKTDGGAEANNGASTAHGISPVGCI